MYAKPWKINLHCGSQVTVSSQNSTQLLNAYLHNDSHLQWCVTSVWTPFMCQMKEVSLGYANSNKFFVDFNEEYILWEDPF